MAGDRVAPDCCGRGDGTAKSNCDPRAPACGLAPHAGALSPAMNVLEVLGTVADIALRAFVVIAPLLAWQWVAIWARPWRRRAGGLGDPTVLAGMMLGIAVLAVILPPEGLNWSAIVSVGGFWDLGLMQFVQLARSMEIHGPGALLAVLLYDDARRDMQA